MYKISIHAPREGSDMLPYWQGSILARFLSTLPVRGATILGDLAPLQLVISIHAPREGSDRSVRPTVSSRSHFYPRSP